MLSGTSLTACWPLLTAKPAAGQHTQIRLTCVPPARAAAATPLHTNSAFGVKISWQPCSEFSPSVTAAAERITAVRRDAESGRSSLPGGLPGWRTTQERGAVCGACCRCGRASRFEGSAGLAVPAAGSAGGQECAGC
jgi:hypothetical protein